MIQAPPLSIQNAALRTRIKSSYTVREVQELTSFLRLNGTFEFPALDNGLFPASVLAKGKDYSGYANVWVRDNIQIAFAHLFLGEAEVTVRNVSTLAEYFRRHRHRFENIIKGERDPENPMERPHVRFNGRTLQEIDQQWAHAQNDALGYFLWLYSEMAVRKQVDANAEVMETLALFALYFQKIRYWEDEDSGHWEESRKVAASSIGVVVAALEKLKCLVATSPLASACVWENRVVSIGLLNDLIAQGQAAMKRILPAECIQSRPEQYRRYDAALLFLIFPLAVVSADMGEQILHNVTNHLQGPYGIRRYLGDSYWAPDYKKTLGPAERTVDFSERISERNALLSKEGDEAQWSIFDPIVSIIFGHNYQSKRRPELLAQQTYYLNRALGQITGQAGPVRALRCPELYYLSNGRYVPNDHVPLLWTQANLAIALEVMNQSLQSSQAN